MTAAATIPAITVRRRILASVREIFDAWLDPTALAEWFCPSVSGTKRSIVTVGPRVGGAFEIVMHIPPGQASHSGIYKAIDAPHYLVFTWNSRAGGPHDSLVTVELRPDGEATEVVITHERLPEDVRAGHIGGWTELLESLEKFVATLK